MTTNTPTLIPTPTTPATPARARAKGTLLLNEFGNGFVNLANPPITVYIPKNSTSRAYHLETVEIEYTPSTTQQAPEQVLSQVEQYTGKVVNYTLVGKIMTGMVHHIFKAVVYIYVPELKLANLVQITTPIYLEKGAWVQLRITQDTHEPNQVLGELLRQIPNDINNILEAKYNLSHLDLDQHQHQHKHLDTSQQSHQSLNHLELEERDQTHLNTLTIDPPASVDCDDAFSIEFPQDTPNQAVIYVHIANVAYYFNPQTTPPALWNEIIKRGTTYYGVHHNWPMIPGAYSNGVCSILPDKPEPTHVLTCEFHYNLETKALQFAGFYCSVVASKAKLDYDTVDGILATGTFPALQILLESAQVIRAGYKDYILTPETPAHKMVRYWMIHVNTIMCRDIYRYNAVPDASRQETLIKYIKMMYPRSDNTYSREQLVEVINANTDDALLMYLGKVAMQKSYYTSNPSENYHYGIGALGYTHWTSPIRRLPDLLNHCNLLGIGIPPESMVGYLEASNAAELKQDQIERFIATWNNACQWGVGSQVHGAIINVSKVGVSVYIHELQTRYSIHISKLSSQRLAFDGDSLSSQDKAIRFGLFDIIPLQISKIFFDIVEFEVAC